MKRVRYYVARGLYCPKVVVPWTKGRLLTIVHLCTYRPTELEKSPRLSNSCHHFSPLTLDQCFYAYGATLV